MMKDLKLYEITLSGKLKEQMETLEVVTEVKRKDRVKKRYNATSQFISFLMESQIYNKNSDDPEEKLTTFVHASRDWCYDEYGKKIWQKVKPSFVVPMDDEKKYLKDSRPVIENPNYSFGEGNCFTKSYRLKSEHFKKENFDLEATGSIEGVIMTKSLEGFQIDTPTVLTKLEQVSKEREWDVLTELIQKKDILNFNAWNNEITSPTVKRRYNKVGTMVSDLRKYITYKGDQTAVLDFKSSSACMVSTYADSLDKERYTKTLKKGFYEDLSDYLNCNRKKAKNAFCYWLGGAKLRGKVGLVDEYMLGNFSSIHKKVTQLNLSKKGGAAIAYQKLEAKIVLGVIDQLIKEGIDCASIHDGVLIPAKHAKYAHQLLVKAVEDEIGITPTVTTDYGVTGEIQDIKPQTVEDEIAALLTEIGEEEEEDEFDDLVDFITQPTQPNNVISWASRPQKKDDRKSRWELHRKKKIKEAQKLINDPLRFVNESDYNMLEYWENAEYEPVEKKFKN